MALMKSTTILNILYGVLIGIVMTGVVWLSASPPRGTEISLIPTSTPGTITVYISGAVAIPGVYTLPEGSRVGAAISAAGGLIPGADGDSLNLAALLEDGQQIEVLGSISTDHVVIRRININIASAGELDALPSIGLTTAQAIVDYRMENGPFKMIQDIKKVPGIGPATYEKIEDFITVGD